MASQSFKCVFAEWNSIPLLFLHHFKVHTLPFRVRYQQRPPESSSNRKPPSRFSSTWKPPKIFFNLADTNSKLFFKNPREEWQKYLKFVVPFYVVYALLISRNAQNFPVAPNCHPSMPLWSLKIPCRDHSPSVKWVSCRSLTLNDSVRALTRSKNCSNIAFCSGGTAPKHNTYFTVTIYIYTHTHRGGKPLLKLKGRPLIYFCIFFLIPFYLSPLLS